MKKGAVIALIVLVILLLIAAFFIFAKPHSKTNNINSENQNANQAAADAAGITDTDVNSVGNDITSLNDSSDFGDDALNSLG